MEEHNVEGIIARHGADSSALIQILLDVQEEFRYLPKDTLVYISDRLRIPLSRAYSTATFFKAFSLVPRGEHIIRVCLGTACHVGGGVKISEELERRLNIKSGDTTEDLHFSLDAVNCLGCCGLAPVVTVDDDIYGKIALNKVPRILKKYQKTKVQD